MKQEIINYEFDLIQQEVSTSPHFPRNDPRNFRYSTWELHSLLEKITENSHYSIKWIGNLPNSSVLGFFYCMLVGSLKEEGCDSEAFVKLKYTLYQLCRQWLTISEQKTFVEHLCLVEYSKSVTDFLKRSHHLQNILIKIFCSHKRQLRNKNRKVHQEAKNNSKFSQLKIFSILFPFICFQLVEDKVAKLTVNGSVFHLIDEKECIFVIEHGKFSEITQNSKRKENFEQKMDEMSTNKKMHKQRKLNLKTTIDIVEEENEEVDYLSVKKPKILLEGTDLVQSISYLHPPKNLDSKKNSARKKSGISESEIESSLHGKFTILNVSSEQNIYQSMKNYPKVRGSVNIGRRSHKINENTQKKSTTKFNHHPYPQQRCSQIVIKKGARDVGGQNQSSADRRNISAGKRSDNQKKKVPMFLQKKGRREKQG